MSVRILNPLDIPDWDVMAACLPGYTFFHTAAWCRVLTESYGYQPVYFTAWRDNELVSALPLMEVDSMWTGRRGVSLPFSDFCDPLLSEAHNFSALFEAIVDYARQRCWKFIELRGAGASLPDKKPSDNYLGHCLDLSKGIGALQKGLRDSTRRNIRKAEKSGIKIEMGQSEESVKAFYQLNCMTRQRHGLPPQPFRFFRNFFQYVIDPGLGSIVSARINGKITAAAVYVHASGNGSVLYKYGASDKAQQHLRANNLVMWEGIKWYAERGFDSMLMGRTDLDHEGLRQFKMGWNTEEYPINYYRYEPRFRAFKNGIKPSSSALETKILQHTPLPILRSLGTVLYRHFG